MSKISLAFRSFFALLFGDELPADIVTELGLTRKVVEKRPPLCVSPMAPCNSSAFSSAMGRLLDFLQEDIAPYSMNRSVRRRAACMVLAAKR